MQFVLLLNQIIILNMNYFFKTLLIVFSISLLTSCDEETKPTETVKFKDELKSFNNTMEKVDQTMGVMDEMQNELDKVDNDVSKGNLTEEDAAMIKEKINEEFSHELAKSANVNPARRLPNWARELGLKEPQGLKIDRDISQTTSENNPSEGYNSVLLIYMADYEKAMEQAAIIAKEAGIPMSKDYVMAKQMEKEIGEVIIMGVAYMNFEIGAEVFPKYSIAITVDENGVLAISANDTYKMTEQLTQ
jgi:uncharacterized protein (DUF4415 family)